MLPEEGFESKPRREANTFRNNAHPESIEPGDSKRYHTRMESASNKAASSAKRHYSVAVLVSLGLSLLFWLVFDIFDLVSFVLWTSIAALLGTSIGLVVGRKLWITVVSTLSIQTLILSILLLIG
ncbi:MAG: hypothetical protein O3B41_01550 [Bacteroidetes bacterium]|nr:hypothetical protein [Bacteroidota bacterium]